jgi:hypothetical protein
MTAFVLGSTLSNAFLVLGNPLAFRALLDLRYPEAGGGIGTAGDEARMDEARVDEARVVDAGARFDARRMTAGADRSPAEPDRLAA